MAHDNRVVWSEGMFLRVQHFQQADRWAENIIAHTGRALVAFPWGVSRLSVNKQLLGTGRVGLSDAAGLMPDGTAFDAPGATDLPPPLEIAEGEKNRLVYLALPIAQKGGAEIGDGRSDARNVRYEPVRYESQDTNLGSSIVMPIDIGRLKLRLKLEGEDMAGFERIAIARVVEVKQDQNVILDEVFVPTTLNCGASLVLESIASEILGIVTHRAEAIADRMGDPSVRGTAEVSDFQFLQVLNRYESILRHRSQNLSSTHPEDLYALFVQLAGEISTFTKERRRGIEFSGYRHADLQSSFAPVVADIRESLSTVLERSAIEIPLEERRHGVRVGLISDRGLLTGSGFVLAVRSDLPQEALRSSLPRQIKIGPVERIAELVNVALPGIAINPLPVAPRQLPYRPGTTYFELDKDGPLWKQLTTTGGIALHIAGEFPSIEIELWAIKA
ncbi:type VI secretion system baseplate subunit TssK [Mesorhizobium amorphae]